MTDTERFNHMVGRRIQYARKASNMTQEALTAAMNFNSRQTLGTIEEGTRKVVTDELLRFMAVLKKPLEFFTDPFLLIDEAQVSWRASSDKLDTFRDKMLPVVGLYQHLQEKRTPINAGLHFHSPLTAASSFEEAIEAGETLAQGWQLGQTPAKTLEQVAQEKLNLIVLYLDAPKGISGAAVHLPKLDAIIINRNEPAGRRAYDLGHELFHVLTWNTMPPPEIENALDKKQKRIEGLAENFTAALLMPSFTITPLFQTRGEQPLQPWILNTAGALGVSGQALYWRLVQLGCISKDSLNPDQLKQKGTAGKPKLYSQRFVSYLHAGIDNGDISIGKVTKLLDCDMDELAELFKDYGMSPPFDL